MQTSPAGRLDHTRARAWRSPARRSSAGFTLLELLVCLVILAFVAALVPPMLARTAERSALRGAVSSLSAELRLARSGAIAANAVRGVVIDPDRRSFGPLARPDRHRLPDSASVVVRTAAAARVPAGSAIRFFPNGSSTGGEIAVAAGTTGYLVSVNWLTGRVRVEELADGR
jgi:general secretion pathway protein H